jgi:murein endopeptidase
MTLRSFVLFCSVLAFSTSCTLSHSKSALSIENLLLNSAEVVSFPISDNASVHTIKAWIGDELPSHATLSCPTSSNQCTEVARILKEKNITVDAIAEEANKVVLSYDHTTTRNCPPHAFGCSVSANALQMISNHNQVLHPATLDQPGAAQAVDTYKRYRGESL